MKKVFSFLLVLALGGTAAAMGSQEASIAGQVRQKDGRTWEDLEVRLFRAGADTPFMTCQSDGDGRYHFDKLPSGNYRIELGLEASDEAVESFLAPGPLDRKLEGRNIVGADFVLLYSPNHLNLIYRTEFQTFDQEDRSRFPAPGGALFVGSSSIRFWTSLAQDMDPLPAIRRGFGGSTMDQLLVFLDRLVIQYKPKVVVVYEGDNDLAPNDASEEDFLANYRTFLTRVTQGLPGIKVYILSIKPSLARWDRWSAMNQANQKLKALAADFPHTVYLDTTRDFFGPEGKPRAELFRDDGLHMTASGYALWTAVVKPRLIQDFR